MPAPKSSSVSNLPQGVQQLEVRVREISFQSFESGYTVLLCKDSASEKIITAVGEMPLVKENDHLRLSGHWIQHARFGRQFRVQSYESILPSGVREIEAFLASGLIQGIGPATAKRLVQHFGDQTLTILDQQPLRLEEVPSIGTRKREQIIKSWQERRGLQPIIQFLQQHGLSASLAPKLYQEYGATTLQKLQERPYELALRWGLGFEAADAFARQLAQSQMQPWQPDHPERLQVGLRHSLQKASRDGHLYLPLAELLDKSARLLGVSHTQLIPALEALFERRELLPEAPAAGPETAYDVYLSRYGLAEQESAEHLARLLQRVEQPDPAVFSQWLADYEATHGIELAAGQRQAVEQAASSKVFILTGGPGTGKTTVSKAILSWFKHQQLRFKLASPTGRAARRLSEVTGEEALTIHRLLEFDPHNNAFTRDQSLPLKTDVLLLDEVSMVDLPLFAHLLEALTDQTRLILIGDKDQLPSVGPGAVLAQLLNCGQIPAVQLTEIYRQAQSSRIVQNAHLVNHGQPPLLLPPAGRHRNEDAFFIQAQQPEAVLQQLLELVAQRLPQAGHLPSEIQVLCPMKRGAIGTQALNSALQSVLNPAVPAGPELKSGPRIFRPGDRVIQLKNNYEHEIFNGDLGKVLRVDLENRVLEVSFAERTVEISHEQISELDLAYALTIHKSQGAEFPVVVVVLTRQHHVMLQRNLLYTGMTRAQKLLILLGESVAIQQAVRNERLRQRYTRLGERLQNCLRATAETQQL